MLSNKTMIKMLYANGCSLTEGSELGNDKFNFDEKKYGPNTSRIFDHLTKEHVAYIESNNYVYRLKEMLNIPEHQNNALGGSCNKRILRTSIIDIEFLLTKYDPSEIFVVIGWTSFDRTEVFTGTHFQQVVPSHIPHDFTKGQKKYMEYYSEVVLEQLEDVLLRHMSEIIILKKYLEKKNITYLFTYALASYLEPDYGDEAVQIASKNHDVNVFTNFVNYESWFLGPNLKFPADMYELFLKMNSFTFYDFANKNGYKCGNGFHPLEEAHEAWADELHKFITAHKLLGY